MSPEGTAEKNLEVAHVLFIDIVGYSKRLVDEQTRLVRRLNELARQSEEARAAEAAGKLIRIPTGDGMALAFFTAPDAPLRCAIELSEADRADQTLELRMGIHSGLVDRIADVNDRANIAGAGINMAQRVMDCGDAGHILLSKRVAEDLVEHSRWHPYLHELGEVEVKHGIRTHVFNFYTDEIGNAELPEKFAKAQHEQESVAAGLNSRRRILLFLGSLLLILAIGLGAWSFGRRHAAIAAPAAPQVGSLAVKPLDNYSGDSSKDYFADGMTDELINKLSQISGLKRVISRSTMMKYKRASKSAAEIGRELNVAAVVEGSVVLSQDQARISVELVDAAADKTLWAQSYTRTVANIVNLQNEVALAVADAIAVNLTPGEKARLTKGRLVNPEAYDRYLRGKFFFGSGEAATNSSIEMLEKSVALDPTYPAAWAELSIAYGSKGFFLEAGQAEWEKKSQNAVAKALELDPELPAAHLAKAQLLWRPSAGFQHEATIAELRRALSVAPNFGDAHVFLGKVYFHVGLLAEALREFQRADEITPGTQGVGFYLGRMALFEGNYDKAAAIMKENMTGMVRTLVEYNIASALWYAGRRDEAKARIQNAKAQFKDEGGLLTAMEALFFAADGDKRAAKAKIDEAIKIGEGYGHFHHTAHAIASAYALMDEPDSAIKWLSYAAENGYPDLTWFERDPNLDKLRKDPRFVALLDRLRPRYERLKALANTKPGA